MAANKPPTTYSDLAASVFTDIVAPDYREEVKEAATWRHIWSTVANTTEAIAHIFLGIGTILAYAAGFFDIKYIAFSAGICSTICLALLRYSVYAKHESDNRNTILNRLLAAAGLGPDPSITVSDTDAGAGDDPAPAPPVAPANAPARPTKKKHFWNIAAAAVPVATRVDASVVYLSRLHEVESRRSRDRNLTRDLGRLGVAPHPDAVA
jgi:hypothetical protein